MSPASYRPPSTRSAYPFVRARLSTKRPPIRSKQATRGLIAGASCEQKAHSRTLAETGNLAGHHGMRFSEATALTAADIDADANTCRINKTLTQFIVIKRRAQSVVL